MLENNRIMFNKILVPTDFTEKSYNAMEIACKIAEKTSAEIELLYIVELPLGVRTNIHGDYESKLASSKDYIEEVKTRANTQLNLMKDKFHHFNCIITTRTQLEGNPGNIPDLISKHYYDLLVVGGRTIYGLDEFFDWSNAEKLVQISKFPILVVNNKIEDFDIKRIILATRFKNKVENIIETVKDLQKSFNAKMHLLYINTPSHFETTHEIEGKVKLFTKKHDLNNFTLKIYNDKGEEEGIMRYAHQIDADLIILTTDNVNRLQRLIRGGVAENMARHSIKPVMTFNLKRIEST